MVTPLRTSLALAGSLAVVFASACNTNPEVSSGNTGGSGGNFGLGGSSGGGGKGGNTGGGFVLPDGGGKPTGGAAGNNGTGGTCGLMEFNLEKRPAELLLVLDRSGSMKEPAVKNGATSKWQDTVPALDETIKATASAVQWGLKMFPAGAVQCAVADGIDVPIAVDNYTPMSTAITMATPEGQGTPTSAAMNSAVAYLKANPSQNNRFILLATDGEPNCANGMSGGRNNSDQAGAVAAVKAAADAGYATFVVGIATSTGDGDATLSLLADAGGRPRAATPKYYPVASKADLISALGLITGQIADCVFPLNMAPPSPNDVAVDVGSVRAVQKTDWEYGAGNKNIRLLGAKCDAVKAGNVPVKITFGCVGFVIP